MTSVPLSHRSRSPAPTHGVATGRGSPTAWILGLAASTMFLDVEFHVAGVIVRIFDLTLLVLSARYAMQAVSGRTPKLPPGAETYLGLQAVLILYSLINAAFLTSFGAAAVDTIQALLFLGFFIIGVDALRTEENFWAFIKAFCIGVWLISLGNAGYHFATGHFFGFKDLGEQKLSHPYSMIMTLLIVLYAPGRKGWLLWLLVVIAGLLTLMSGERKGWVAVLAAIVAVSAIMNNGRFSISRIFSQAMLLGAILVPVVIIIQVALPDTYLSKQVTSLAAAVQEQIAPSLNPLTNTLETASNRGRSYGYQVAMAQVKEHPVFGIGITNFDRKIRITMDEQFDHGVHSEYLRLLVETGVVGLLLYFVALGVAGGRALTAMRTIPVQSPMWKFRTRSGIALLVFGLTVIAFKATGGVNMFVIMLAVMMLYFPPSAAGEAAAAAPAQRQVRQSGWRYRPVSQRRGAEL